MTNVINIHESNNSKHSHVERIDSGNILVDGMYAVVKDVRSLEKLMLGNLQNGDVLLILELVYANDQLHSVVLKNHPRNFNNATWGSTSILFADFHDHFDLMSREDGLAIREKELGIIYAQLEQQRQHVSDLQKNPQQLQQIALSIYSKRISHIKPMVSFNGDISALLGAKDATQQIEMLNSQASMAADLIEIQGNYMKEEIAKISELVQHVAVYTTEKYQGGIAAHNDQTHFVGKLNEGMTSLNLYLGKGVEIREVCSGKSASSDIKLTLMQECLYADEELSFFQKIHRIERMDAGNVNLFLEELRNNQAFVDQIFPTQRCICVMALRRKSIEYNDFYLNEILNKANKETFLLIRNGENIYQVYSPIGSHLAATNLFPSKDSLEKHFLSTGSTIEINIDQLTYSKAMSDVEREVLHYKRFMILLSGLQQRMNMLGDFYPLEQSFNILYPAFQEKYFHFIHDQDGEGLLGFNKYPDLEDFIKLNQAKLFAGAYIACNANLLTKSHHYAPACYRYRYSGPNEDPYKKVRNPIDRLQILKVMKDDSGFYVKIPCSNYGLYSYNDKIHTVNSRVAVIPQQSTYADVSFMVLDGLTNDEIEYYLSSRKHRKQYTHFVELFRYAKESLQEVKHIHHEEYALLQDYCQTLIKIDKPEYLVDSDICTATHFFAGAKRMENAKAYLSCRLDAKHGVLLRNRIEEQLPKGVDLISATMDRKGEIFVYTTMEQEARLDQFGDHRWIYRFSLRGKKRVLSHPEVVDLRENMSEEREIEIYDKVLYQHYYKSSSFKTQTSAVYSGLNTVRLNHKGFKLFSSLNELPDVMHLSKELLKALVSNTVDRAMIEKVKPLISRFDQTEATSTNLLLPAVIATEMTGYDKSYERMGMVFILIEKGIDYLRDLANRYSDPVNQDLEILPQNLRNGHTFNVVSYEHGDRENMYEYFFEVSKLNHGSGMGLSKYVNSAYSLNYLAANIELMKLKEIKYSILGDLSGDQASPVDLDHEFGNVYTNGVYLPLHGCFIGSNQSKVVDRSQLGRSRIYLVGEEDKIDSYAEKYLQQLNAERTESLVKGVDMYNYHSKAYGFISDERDLPVFFKKIADQEDCAAELQWNDEHGFYMCEVVK